MSTQTWCDNYQIHKGAETSLANPTFLPALDRCDPRDWSTQTDFDFTYGSHKKIDSRNKLWQLRLTPIALNLSYKATLANKLQKRLFSPENLFALAVECCQYKNFFTSVQFLNWRAKYQFISLR